MKSIFLSAALALLTAPAFAQTNDVVVKVEERVGDSLRTTTVTVPVDTGKSKNKVSISLGADGIEIVKKKSGGDSVKKKPSGPLKIQWGMLDLGFNRIDDRTVYDGNAAQQAFFNGTISAPGTLPNSRYSPEEAFKLREGKSINVNVWILNARLRLAETKRQKLYLTSGLGLQMYNFRFESDLMYRSDPTRLEYIPSDVRVQKNKLGFTYAAVPLGLLAKTRVGDKWLVYGVGVTGGYRIASWTKLKSDQFGKQKNHDAFNFADFNACVTAEVGIDDFIRLYGSYQMTSLHKDKAVLDQHPFAIGVRFIGL